MIRLAAIIFILTTLTACEVLEAFAANCRCDSPDAREYEELCDGSSVHVCREYDTYPGSDGEDVALCRWEVRDVCEFGCENAECLPCEPDCEGRVCGSDGCDGSCGECSGDLICDEESGLCGSESCAPTQQLACGDRLEGLTFSGSGVTNDVIINGCPNPNPSYFNGVGPEMVFSFEADETPGVYLDTRDTEVLVAALTPGPGGECNLSECFDASMTDFFAPVPADGLLYFVLETESELSEPVDLEVRCESTSFTPDLTLSCGDVIEGLDIATFPLANDIFFHSCMSETSGPHLDQDLLFSFESTADQVIIPYAYSSSFELLLFEPDESGGFDPDRCVPLDDYYLINAGQTYYVLAQPWYYDGTVLDMVVECCVLDCEGRECGDDSCGGVCGTCDDGSFCQNGSCVST